MSRLRILLIAMTMMVFALPAAATAQPGTTAEPVVMLPGLGENCVSQRYDSADNDVLAGQLYRGIDTAWKASGKVVDEVPRAQVFGWTFSACHRTLSRLAKRFDDYLAHIQDVTGAPKLDVVTVSLGGMIARYCILNPRGATPKCAGRIDDWVGLVNATHGSTKASNKTCLTASLVGLWNICHGLARNSAEILAMEKMEWVPGSHGDVEYSMFWTPEDDFIYPKGSSKYRGARNVSVHSPLGPVTHAAIWIGTACTTVQDWVGLELLDLTPHVVGDESLDCTVPVPQVVPLPPLG